LQTILTSQILESDPKSQLAIVQYNRLLANKPNYKHMKNFAHFLLGIFLLFLQTTIHAQTAEAFLSQLPAVPNSVCNADQSGIDIFTDKIRKVQSVLQAKMEQYSNQAAATIDVNKEKILSTNAANVGISTSDMKKLANGNVSEKEAMSIANKSAQNRYGASIAELQKVANMSEAEQEKWAQEYANKQMQKAQRNPEVAAKKGEKAKRLYDLGMEQKAIADRLSIQWEKVRKAEKNYRYQDSVQSKILEKKLEPLIKDPVLSGGCASAAELQRARALEKQIYNLKKQHCEKMSPILLDYILQYQSALQMSFAEYARQTEIANELSKIQNGVKIIPVESSGLGGVDSYADQLLDAYKYWVPKLEN